MSASPSMEKFIDFFCSNASGVLSTITNQSIDLESKEYSAFDFSRINSSIEIPCVILSIIYSGAQNFQIQLIMDKNAVAALSDLMMLGDGEASYNPEEHNDAIKEMGNQILGSMTAEFAGDGINLSGMVSDVELTDMEIQQDFLVDNNVSYIEFDLVNRHYTCFLIFDSQSENAIDTCIVLDEPQSASAAFSQASSSAGSSKKNEEPVKVSRAQFTEFEEVRPSTGKNINIDLLLDVVLPVTVELGRKDMKIKEVLEIGQGSVVELDKLAGDLVDLLINGKKFAVGEVMVADENYAVRIVSLVSREERIKSLGSD